MAGEAVAWVDVLPSMSRWMPELNRGIQAMMPSAGEAAGRAYGSAWGTAAASQVSASSAQMAAAMRKQADAAGEVRIAETRLSELRASSRATQTQIVTAEEHLEKARRNQAAATDAVTAANRSLTTAQQQHTSAVVASSSATDAHSRTTATLSQRFSALHGAVITAYGAFFAFRAVGSFFTGTIDAARDLHEEINKSTVVFGSSAQSVLAWSRTTAQAMGISQQQALMSAGTFGNLFRTFGLMPDVSAKMSMGLVKLAADLASFNNASPADVLEAMRAGLVGEMEPMRRFGVDLSDAAMKQEAMNLGIYNGVGVLNQSQKAQAAYSLMMQQTQLAQGDFARTSDALANSQRILSAEWTNAKASLGTVLMPVMLEFVHFLSGSLIPALGTTVQFIRDNITWIGPLAAGLFAVVPAIKAVQFATEAFGITLQASTGWIGLVIAAAVALGIGLYELWNRSETFRAIVTNVFQTVAAIGVWMWEKALRPAFEGIMVGWQATTTAVAWAWDNVLHPAWNAVAAIATWLWQNILAPAFAAIASNWQAMVTVIVFAWDNVLHPAWNVLAAIATWLWQNILGPTFSAIGTAWQVMVTGIVWYWDNVLHPAWNVVAAIITWLWQNILGPIFVAILGGWNTMVTAMVWAWDTYLHPMWNAVASVATWLWVNILSPVFAAIGAGWNALMTGMRWVYDNVVHPMWGIMASAVSWVRDVFGSVVNGIRIIWDGIREAVAAPIRFVVNTILNNGLFAAWNWIVDLLNLPGNGKPPGAGGSWKLHFTLPFASGGLIPGFSPTPRADNIPIMATAREFVQPVSAVDRYGIPFMEAVRTGRFPAEIAQGYQRGGSVTFTYPKMIDWVHRNIPGAVITSTYRPGSNDYHGKGQAVDIGAPGNAQSVLDAIGARMVTTWPGSTELIHNPNASIKNGRAVAPSYWGASTWAAHRNHVHWAMTPEALAGRGVIGGFMDAIGVLAHLTGSITSGIGQLLSTFGGGPFMQAMAAFPKWVLGKMWDKVKDTIGSIFASTNTDSVVSNVPGSVADVVRSVFSSRSWHTGAQWSATSNIISRESGWNPSAQNPSSSASGLFQMVDSTWRSYRPASASGAAHMKNASVGDQALAGRNYIAARYGSPVDAWAFWQAHHYYGDGGMVLPWFHRGGHTRGWQRRHLSVMDPDERVLSPIQDDYFRRFVEWAEREYREHAGRALIDTVQVYANDRDQGVEIVEKLWHRLTVARRGGLYPTATVFTP